MVQNDTQEKSLAESGVNEENELLKAYIICEVDNMTAYAPFDELGNKKRYVQRAFLSVGHIIPELEELKEEVELAESGVKEKK